MGKAKQLSRTDDIANRVGQVHKIRNGDLWVEGLVHLVLSELEGDMEHELFV